MYVFLVACCVGFVKVASVVGRADLLSALCFMSAFISYVCAVHSGLSWTCSVAMYVLRPGFLYN